MHDFREVFQKETASILENIISSHAQTCSDLGLPMFIGICLPPKKYKK